MKKILLATALAAFVSPSFAADRPMPLPLPVKPPVYVDIWSGLYFGVNGSYNWGEATCCGLKDKTDGIMFGPTLGYRKQLGNGFILGGEADIDFGNVDKKLVLSPTTSGNFKTGTEGSARFIAGYLISPLAMIYATGGVAFSDNKLTFTFPGGKLSDHEHPYGWTYGAGLEYKIGNYVPAMLAPTSLKIEYRHDDFGKSIYGASGGGPIFVGPKVKNTDDRILFGINYQYSSN